MAITRACIDRFRSNLAQSFITWLQPVRWFKVKESKVKVTAYVTANTDSRQICLVFKATPTIVGEAFIFYLWSFFLQRTDIAARRRSGAPSKVYQWLGPRCRQKVTRKNFANRPPPNFYRGQKVRNLASILKISRLWRALVSKRSNISEI